MFTCIWWCMLIFPQVSNPELTLMFWELFEMRDLHPPKKSAHKVQQHAWCFRAALIRCAGESCRTRFSWSDCKQCDWWTSANLATRFWQPKRQTGKNAKISKQNRWYTKQTWLTCHKQSTKWFHQLSLTSVQHGVATIEQKESFRTICTRERFAKSTHNRLCNVLSLIAWFKESSLYKL